GYRLKEFSQIEEYVDPEFPGASTHYRIGDWEVSKVEEYRGFRSYEVQILIIKLLWCGHLAR
ncbi:MAG: hypothetical protein ACKPFJ_02080, partial [Dolichospermum sp.]